jgi:alpha-ketoglutarate-dependent 2,4-dichlorophenoxyacetate dioxygenase
MRPKIRELNNSFVAEVIGVNISTKLNQKAIRKLRFAFQKYAVLILRNQDDATYATLSEFAQLFGKPSKCNDISNIDDSNNIIDPSSLDARYARGNQLWHVDMLVLERPPLAAMLLARELPADGSGQTQFADLSRAWTQTSPSKRKLFRNLVAVHSLEAIRQRMGITASNEIQSEYAPTEHPLVCVDPSSGKRCLLFGAHTSHIKGMPAAESDALLNELLRTVTLDDEIYTHTWQVHDLVIWNNRRVMHRVLPYDDRFARRRLWRMEILTDNKPKQRRELTWKQFIPW